MRITASHSTKLFALLAIALAGSACPSDDEGTTIDIDLGAAIRVNDASEEVLGVIVDEIEQGNLVVDDSLGASLVAPEPGSTVPAATPFTFAWSVPSKPDGPRHGTATGEFVWLRLEGGGLARTIDVIAVDEASWTPDAAVWAEITASTGPISLTLTNAYAMDGLVVDGPYRRFDGVTTFSVAQ
jgi:hypothetical protein